MDYSITEHRSLLEKKQQDNITKEEETKLEKYNGLIYDQIIWGLREDYRQLFEEYLSKKSAETLCMTICTLCDVLVSEKEKDINRTCYQEQ